MTTSEPRTTPVRFAPEALKAFYLQHLVPAGQSLELVAACFEPMRNRLSMEGRYSSRAQFKRVGYRRYSAMLLEEGFGGLHLVNIYLQSNVLATELDGDISKLAPLGKLLDQMRDLLCTRIRMWCERLFAGSSTLPMDQFVSLVMSKPGELARSSMKLGAERLVEMEDLILAQRALLSQLESDLDVKGQGLRAWKATYLNTAAPLCLGGRISIWRTLVNNLPWDEVARTLKAEMAPTNATWLGSRPGRQHIDRLMDRAFAPLEVLVPPASRSAGEHEEEVSPTAAVEAAVVDDSNGQTGPRLPKGVTLSVLPSGYVRVAATFVSRRPEVLSELGVEAKDLQNLHSTLQKWLEVPVTHEVFASTCSFTEVAGLVPAAESELAFAADLEQMAIEQLRRVVADKRAKLAHRTALLARLNKVFSPKDIEELKDVLENGV